MGFCRLRYGTLLHLTGAEGRYRNYIKVHKRVKIAPLVFNRMDSSVDLICDDSQACTLSAGSSLLLSVRDTSVERQ